MKYTIIKVLLILSSFSVVYAQAEQEKERSIPKVASNNVVTFISQQSILGAEKPIPIGELVELSIKPIDSPPPNLVGSSYDWKIVDISSSAQLTELQFKVVGDGSSIYMGTGSKSKKLLVIACVTHLFMTKEANSVKDVSTKTQLLKTELVIGLPPPPKPEPEPEPDVPDFPQTKYNLHKAVWKVASEKLPSSEKDKPRLALIKSLEGFASKIAATNGNDTLDIKDTNVLVELEASNRSSVIKSGGNRDNWVSVFTLVQEELWSLYSSKEMTNLSDLRLALLDVAEGLKRVEND